ncbi:MAG TPA: 50S ribosomal protein L11 methyltransferase [Solirubrobacter sp.]|nr:50S ribosomal protein L11 methyltransferase [Solirubrobacter sp.]
MIRLGIRVRAADAEIAFARLEPVLAGGAEEVELGEAVEFAVYGEDVPDARLRELAGDALIAVTREPVEPGWDRAWHEHIEPVTVGALTFRPPWLPGDGIVIEPGLTFGLASHPTTQLCLELLQELEPTPLADWGCGSGVLAIAAAKLGFDPVTAIEIDPAAVAVARENARRNEVDIRVERGDARREAPYAPTVVANLALPVLTALEISRLPDTLIASGILAGQTLELPGLVERERREASGWAALVLRPA